jgi:hypothetical protein
VSGRAASWPHQPSTGRPCPAPSGPQEPSRAQIARAIAPDGQRAAAEPSRAQIARAIQPGTRRARKQSQYVADALAELEAAGFRSDRVRHWGRIIETLSRHMNWDTRCTRPTWQLLAEQAADPGKPPLHRSTVARCLEWLRGRGLLGVVSTGWTRLFRPGALDDGKEPNQAAVYVLTTPGSASEKRAIRTPIEDRTKGNATLTCLPTGEAPTRVRTREAGAGQEPGQERIGAPSGRAVPAAAPRPGPDGASRRENRAEGLRWAAAVRALAPKVLGRLSDRYVRSLGREERAAGWTPGDFVRALWEPPQGRAYGFSHEVRYPAAWARARLAAWRAPDGTIQPSWSQARAAAAAATRADQAARRAAQDAARARAVDAAASGHAAAARAALAAASSRARAAMVQAAADARAARR